MSMWKNISVEETELMLESKNVILFDLREYKDYLRDHHPRALLMTDQNRRAMLKHTAREVPVIFCSYHGNRSQDMARLFADFGFVHSFSVEGGYERWFPQVCLPRTKPSRSLSRWLIENQFDIANLDYRADYNQTALMVAARRGEESIVNELLHCGASVNLVDQDGNNALWMACLCDSLSIANTLIDAGINMDQQNDHGATAMILAASLGQLQLVRLLLEAGANTELTTQDDLSASDVASSRAVYKQLNVSEFHAQACM